MINKEQSMVVLSVFLVICLLLLMQYATQSAKTIAGERNDYFDSIVK